MTEPPSADRTLELSGPQLRRLVELSLAHVERFLAELPDRPARSSDGAEEVAREVIEPLPESGEPAADVLARFFERYVPVGFNPTSPGYLAYVPGGGLPHAAVADFVADITNRYVSVWHAAPAIAQIEATVVRWFCDMVGYPPAAGGFLTTGGSLANLSAVVTARLCRAGDDFREATIYTSNQAHHSVAKAATLAGFPSRNLRLVPVDPQFRVRVDLLAEQIARDREAGCRPLIIVGHAGTTNTGAVDDLTALADVAAAEQLWLHVDAAYGGFFLLTERGRHALRGIDRADSITLDPHKGLFLPYGTGCLLVQRRADLERTHETRAAYMPPAADPEFFDFCQISPELSRDFRGLRIWLPMKLHGAGPFRNNLDEKLDLARWAADQLRQLDAEIPDSLEIVAEPQLSIVAFRLTRPGLDTAAANQLNQSLLERINASGRFYLTPTMLDGHFVIRICVLCFRTHREHLQECLQTVRQAVGEVA